MERHSKSFQELTIQDNFMFGAVMMDEEICRHMIELALGFQVEKVEVIAEKSMIYRPEYRGIRLDVYAKDKNHTHYDVEMQVRKKEFLEKRARYYHSHMDMELLEKGEDYEKLPNSYVIFICCFDPFGDRLFRYTVSGFCRENGKMIDDGTISVYLSTEGENSNQEPEELVQFLRYVKVKDENCQFDCQDDFVRRMQRQIQEVKKSREMEGRYMLLELMLRDERKEGREEKLLEMVQKKLMKEKSAAEIAEDLEEEEETIQRLIRRIQDE